jgi:hypothetical protein
MCFFKLQKVREYDEYDGSRKPKKRKEVIETEYIQAEVLRMPNPTLKPKPNPKPKKEHVKSHRHHRRHSCPPLRLDFEIIEVESFRGSSDGSISDDEVLDRRHKRYQTRRWWEEPEADDGEFHNWNQRYIAPPVSSHWPERKRRDQSRRRFPSRRDDFSDDDNVSFEIVTRTWSD